MSTNILVVVVEGNLEVPVVLKMLGEAGFSATGVSPIVKNGQRPFWRDVKRYNNAAKFGPVVGLVDLEKMPCPSGLIEQHLNPINNPKHPDFILRVAEPMVESWLLADRERIAAFLQISPVLIPRFPESEAHPKKTIVSLARKSKKREIRDDIVPPKGSAHPIGRGYTPRMSQFVREYWRPGVASGNSQSLEKALSALEKLKRRN